MLHEYAERLYLPAAGVEMPAAVGVAAGAEGRQAKDREAGALVDGSSDGVADSSAVGASLAGRGRKRPPKRRASAPPVEVVSSLDGATNGELEAEEAREEQAKPLVRRTG